MTTIDIQGFTNLKDQVKSTQSKVPQYSLDWNIYQGQVDLLAKVEALFSEQTTPKEIIYPLPSTKQVIVEDASNIGLGQSTITSADSESIATPPTIHTDA